MANDDPTRDPDPVDTPEQDPTSVTDDALADSAPDETASSDTSEENPSTELVPQDEAGELAETDEPEQPGSDHPAEPTKAARPPQPELHRQTRIGAAWVALAVGVVILVLLLIFIFKNNESTPFWLFGLNGQMPLGVLLLFAACGGALIVIVLGFARILQMRLLARRDRRSIKK